MNGLPCPTLPYSVLLPHVLERTHDTYSHPPAPVVTGLASAGKGGSWPRATPLPTVPCVLHVRYQEISQSIKNLFSKLLSYFSKCFLEVFEEAHWKIRSDNIGKIEFMERGNSGAPQQTYGVRD